MTQCPLGQHNNILSSLSRRLTSASRAESTHLVLKQCSTSDGSSPNSSSELKISLVSEKEEPQGWLTQLLSWGGVTIYSLRGGGGGFCWCHNEIYLLPLERLPNILMISPTPPPPPLAVNWQPVLYSPPFVVCWQRLIPPLLPPKTMLTPPPQRINNEWSLSRLHKNYVLWQLKLIRRKLWFRYLHNVEPVGLGLKKHFSTYNKYTLVCTIVSFSWSSTVQQLKSPLELPVKGNNKTKLVRRGHSLVFSYFSFELMNHREYRSKLV